MNPSDKPNSPNEAQPEGMPIQQEGIGAASTVVAGPDAAGSTPAASAVPSVSTPTSAAPDAQPAAPQGAPVAGVAAAPQDAQVSQAAPAPTPGSASAASGTQTMPMQQPVTAPAPAAAPKGSWGWIALGIFIPLVGLILFLVWRKTNPKSAKASGIGAIIGVVAQIVITIITTIALMPLMMNAYQTELNYNSHGGYGSYATSTSSTSSLATSSSSDADASDDVSANAVDSYFATDDDYIKITGSDILPELGDASYWFEPGDSYFMNPTAAEGEWYYGSWTYADDPSLIEVWGVKVLDGEEGDPEVIGTVPEDQFITNFRNAGWTEDIDIL